MSYGARSMSEKDDLLFRVKIHAHDYEYESEITHYDNETRKIVRTGKFQTIYQKDYVTYVGPYTELRSARGAVTREVKQAARTHRDGRKVDIDLEVCMPEWKVVE